MIDWYHGTFTQFSFYKYRIARLDRVSSYFKFNVMRQLSRILYKLRYMVVLGLVDQVTIYRTGQELIY